MSPDPRSSASGCPSWLKETGKLTAAAAAGFGLAFLVNGSESRAPSAPHVAAAPVKQEAPKPAISPAPVKPMPPHLSAAARLGEAFELARTDPDELRRRIGEAKDPQERLLLIRGLFAHLADSLSPREAIAEALKFKDADEAIALKELAAVWLGRSLDPMMGMRSDSSAVLQAGLALIHSSNAREGTAEAWVQAFKNHPARLELLSAMASKLTASDPQRALAMAGGLTEWERRKFFDTVLVDWAGSDPVAARKWMTDPANAADASDRRFPWATASYQHAEWVASALAAEKDPATRLEMVRGLAAAMANNGTREALAWADSLTNPAERDAAHDRIYEATPRGIGAVLSSVDGYPRVNSVLPESASARAGLQAGDRFIEVTGPDGKAMPLYQQPLDTTVTNLRGEAGETVTLRILRDAPGGGTSEHMIRLTRDQLVFPSNLVQKLPK